MIDIEIDGKKISVKEGSMIIEAADQENIYIPRFCYHKKLKVAANCRMCLVEVEKTNKPLPACATPVMPDMKVKTCSKMAIDAQKSVMEYLLINHPLDCPICDQGGECELQDLTMGYGSGHSNYNQSKRAVADENLGPLIETCMTRCIQCTRCVRFGEEIAGMRELGVLNRTQEERIGTYIKHVVKSELSGNIIDLCPVGALLSKPFRYTARGWELRETPMIAPHDCVGANVYVHSRGYEYDKHRKVMRVVPRENESVNQTWISDRDRFSYLGLSHPGRIMVPQIKQEGSWQEVSWSTAIETVRRRLTIILDRERGNQIAGLVSPNATLEECYLFQKWLRRLGCSNIDHRFRQQDFSDQQSWPLFPNLGMPIAELSEVKTLFLLGADLRNEQPLLSQRIFQAYQKGASVMTVGPYDFPYPFSFTEKLITTQLAEVLQHIVATLKQSDQKADSKLAETHLSRIAKKMAERLAQTGQDAVILMGDFGLNHPDSSKVRQLLSSIAKMTGAKIATLTEGANSAGAWLAGAIPHRGALGQKIEDRGESAFDVLVNKPKRAYLLMGTELEYDCSYSASALNSLQGAELVVCLTSFVTDTMLEYADIILPIAPFTETSGTYVNVSGHWQSFEEVTIPYGQCKPAWKLLCELAEEMELEGFHFKEVGEVSSEIKNLAKLSGLYEPSLIDERLSYDYDHSSPLTPILTPEIPKLTRYAPWPIYKVDGLCRRAPELQEMSRLHNLSMLTLHTEVAEELGVQSGDWVLITQGEQQITLPVNLSNLLAKDVVILPSALDETAGFGQAFSEVSIQKGESE